MQQGTTTHTCCHLKTSVFARRQQAGNCFPQWLEGEKKFQKIHFRTVDVHTYANKKGEFSRHLVQKYGFCMSQTSLPVLTPKGLQR